MEWGYVVLAAISAIVITLSAAHNDEAEASALERWLQQQPLIVRAILGGAIGGVAITALFVGVQQVWIWHGLWWTVGWVGGSLIAHGLLARRGDRAGTSE